MKKQILLFLLAFLPLLAHAFTGEVVIDGINYYINTGTLTAEVRAKSGGYSGDVVIPPTVDYDGVTCNVLAICNEAFYGCTSLTSITIPNSVTSIGYSAFSDCTNLNAVYISDIEAWCKILFNDNPLRRAHRLFLNGEEVKDLVIPNSVTSIGEEAFSYCSSLISISIPNSVTSIGFNAFSCCINLTSLTIPNSLTSIGVDAFSGCSSLTSITIPNSVTSIGAGAFSGCTSLTTITIPNSVTSIKRAAFSGCGLTSISIGSGVQEIDEFAFANCNLTHVYCHAVNVPTTYSNPFEGSYPQYATLHVPDESLDAYRNKSPWSQFGTIVGLSGGGGSNKCATPTISYGGKKLMFVCDTEDVEFVTEIKDADIGKFFDDRINLTATYEISVYATKAGYENSDVATATLVWGSATFTDTTPATAIEMVPAMEAAMPVLIQNNGGMLTIQGAADGTPISVYTIAGTEAGSAVSQNSMACISTNLQQGSIAIVRIGNRSVKVVLK